MQTCDMHFVTLQIVWFQYYVSILLYIHSRENKENTDMK